jgi:hypothetical protein
MRRSSGGGEGLYTVSFHLAGGNKMTMFVEVR